MKNKQLIILTTFFILFFLSNCGEKKSKIYPLEGTAPPIHIEDPATQIRWNSVGIIDDKIAKKIAVEQTNARRTATNTLEVWALLRNRTDYPLQIEARVQFFNANKEPIEGPTAWKRIYLPPNGIQKYFEYSTRTDVNYYYIEIKEGD